MKKSLVTLLSLSILLMSSCGSVVNTTIINPVQEGITAYRVDFVSNGGTYVPSLTTSSLEESPIPERDGYNFTGWHLKEDLSDTAIAFPYTLESDTTLYASWTLVGYLVNYVSNGGTSLDAEITTKIEQSPLTTKEGYSFVGWHLLEDLSDEIVSFPYEIHGETTLYAEWLINECEPQGTYLASAYVANMEARSYWNIQYNETGFVVTVNVVDEYVYCRKNDIGYSDNVEFIVGYFHTTSPAGFVVGSTHFLCDASGRSYYNNTPSVTSMSANNTSLPSGAKATSVLRTRNVDGYNGYSVVFDISYEAINTTKDNAYGKLYFAPAIRNSNSNFSTSWGNSIISDFSNGWSYLRGSIDNRFIDENEYVEHLVFSDSTFMPAYWSDINTVLFEKTNVLYDSDYLVSDLDKCIPQIINKDINTLTICVGRDDIVYGKHEPNEMIESFREFIDVIHEKLPNTKINVLSVNPIPKFSNKLDAIKEYNGYLNDLQISYDFITYVNTFNAFVDGDTIKNELYNSDLINLNADGYAVYYNLIKSLFE